MGWKKQVSGKRGGVETWRGGGEGTSEEHPQEEHVWRGCVLMRLEARERNLLPLFLGHALSDLWSFGWTLFLT